MPTINFKFILEVFWHFFGYLAKVQNGLKKGYMKVIQLETSALSDYLVLKNSIEARAIYDPGSLQ